jgi:deoxycytidylate deaminase
LIVGSVKKEEFSKLNKNNSCRSSLNLIIMDSLNSGEPSTNKLKRSRSASQEYNETTGVDATEQGVVLCPEIGSPLGKQVQKREDAVKWDDYFMAVSFLTAMRSKDPSTQVGACIVNEDKRIVGIGYNGFPRGCSDDELPWCRYADNELDTKYPVR